VYLQDALATAKRGDQIHVAEGIYQPDMSEQGHATARDREASFMLLDGVKLLGGFAGLGDPSDPDARDVDVHPSTLTGDLLADDEAGGSTFDNSDHVLVGSGRDRTAILDGFTITAGADNNGGGIYIFAGSPTVSNCRFIKNTRGIFSFTFSSPRVTHCRFEGNASRAGASGIYSSGQCYPVVEHCTFIDNTGLTATSSGGAFSSRSGSSALIIDSTFVHNSAWKGGAVSISEGSDVQLVGCIFRENSAVWFGGAIRTSHSTLLLLNCVFLGNTAQKRGGAVYAYLDAPIIVNSVFSGNTALENGGAVATWNQSDFTLINCSFAGNFAPAGRAFGSESSSQNMPSAVTLRNCIVRDGGPEVFSRDGTVYSMSYSNVSGGWSGIGNINSDARFVREPDHGGDGWGDNPDTPDVDERANNDYGDLRLSFGSPCIDRGELGFVSEFSETDLDGHARILGARVDMGAYEFGIADFDRNGIIDLRDVARLQICFGDPKGGPYASGCEAFDFELDRDVDLEDHAAFLNVFDP
jgi:predicted outer membrane repeat protein